MKKLLVIGAALLAVVGCTRNVDEAKQCGPQTLASQGFTIIGYQGYEWSAIYGGLVWYIMVRDNGITYEAAVVKWGKECHIYNLKALDAIKP